MRVRVRKLLLDLDNDMIDRTRMRNCVFARSRHCSHPKVGCKRERSGQGGCFNVSVAVDRGSIAISNSAKGSTAPNLIGMMMVKVEIFGCLHGLEVSVAIFRHHS